MIIIDFRLFFSNTTLLFDFSRLEAKDFEEKVINYEFSERMRKQDKNYRLVCELGGEISFITS